MYKIKYFLRAITIISIVIFLFANQVFASPIINSFILNGSGQNATFNPNNGESVSIEVKSSVPVKFTRLYICSIDQICNGTSGNYIKYFTQSDISDTVIKSWNGKKSGDTEIVPAGEYKVMVSMTEGTNDPVLEFGQHSIFVDFSIPNNNSTSTNSENSTSTNITNNSTSTSITIINRTTYVSSHSSTEEISNYDEKTPFEITAGRERMATVGSIIEFNAKYTLIQKDQCTPSFRWSFGDGFEGTDRTATHIYKYAGEYQVVLNAVCGEYNAISRTKIVIISPDISMSSLENDDIELLNKGKTEMNIGLWKINFGQKGFIFPRDTIISAKGKIILSREDIGINNITNKVVLSNQLDREVLSVNINTKPQSLSIQNASTSSYSDISVEKAEFLVAEYKKTLALDDKHLTLIDKILAEDQQSMTNKIIQTASVASAISTSTDKGFWSKLLNIPINGVKSFVSIFYDF